VAEDAVHVQAAGLATRRRAKDADDRHAPGQARGELMCEQVRQQRSRSECWARSLDPLMSEWAGRGVEDQLVGRQKLVLQLHDPHCEGALRHPAEPSE